MSLSLANVSLKFNNVNCVVLPAITMNYSKEELVKMVYAIGEVHGNCLLTTRVYKANNPILERFPGMNYFQKLKESL